MSDPIASPTAPVPQPPSAPKKNRATAALILGIVALVLAFVPGASFIAWIPALLAIIFGIMNLRTPKRTLALVGLILGAVAWLIAIIVSIAFIIAGAAGAANSLNESVGVIAPTASTAPSAPTASAEPEPTATEEPVAEPEEEAPDEEVVDTAGVFKSKTFSGSSDDVIKLPKNASFGIIRATYSGASNFVIETLDSSNQMSELPVNTIGNYTGSTAFGLQSEEAVKLKISAQGKWSVTVKSMSEAPKLPSSGKGDGVYRSPTDKDTLKFTNKGDSNFAVVQVTADNGWDLLVNEIGSYSGTVPISTSDGFIVITSNGKWTAK